FNLCVFAGYRSGIEDEQRQRYCLVSRSGADKRRWVGAHECTWTKIEVADDVPGAGCSYRCARYVEGQKDHCTGTAQCVVLQAGFVVAYRRKDESACKAFSSLPDLIEKVFNPAKFLTEFP